jgi:uncharacterized protein with HEPN domain
MPPTLADRLVHILVAIETIQKALANKRPEDITEDLMLRLAVERSLEIICEASRRVPDRQKEQHPEIDWRGMVDFGNELRHAYHRVDPTTLWEIAHRDLPPLKAFAERVIGETK